MSKIIGSYITYNNKDFISNTRICLRSDDLSNNWRRCSLTSDFLSKYFSFFFPYKEKSENTLYREEAENIISFILNELIENTAKYSDDKNSDVNILLAIDETCLVFEISNYTSSDNAKGFLKLCSEILESDPHELYIKKIEENIDTGSSGSGLGYLTLINDYGISFGFMFEDMENSLVRTSVQAKLKYKEENI